MTIEHRKATGVSANGRKLSGYVAKFDSPTTIGGQYTEVIRRGAFAASLASGRDIIAMADHSPDKVLGRTKSGTLELREDAEGLAFTLQLPDTTAARDIVALAERGDLGGMSFGFIARDEDWQGNTRELRAVDLHEITVVSAWPAYGETEVHLRNRQPATPDSRRKWLETVGALAMFMGAFV